MKQKIHPNDMMSLDLMPLGYCAKEIHLPVIHTTVCNEPVPYFPQALQIRTGVWKTLPRGNGRPSGLGKLENTKCMVGVTAHITSKGKTGWTGIC